MLCLRCEHPFLWWGIYPRLCPPCMAEHKRIKVQSRDLTGLVSEDAVTLEVSYDDTSDGEQVHLFIRKKGDCIFGFFDRMELDRAIAAVYEQAHRRTDAKGQDEGPGV